MINVEARLKDAEALIQTGRYKDACGALRPVLEHHLGGLCVRKRLSPTSDRIVDMVHALHDSGGIDGVERSKFLAWNTLGNAGSHVNNDKISKTDAEYFLRGLSALLGHSSAVSAKPAPKPFASVDLSNLVDDFLVKSEKREDYRGRGEWNGRKVLWGLGGRAIHYLLFCGPGINIKDGCYPAIYAYPSWQTVFSVYGMGTEAGGYPKAQALAPHNTIEAYFREKDQAVVAQLRSDPSTRRYNYLDNRYWGVYALGNDRSRTAESLSVDLQKIAEEVEGGW